jgi:hypothetical protein
LREHDKAWSQRELASLCPKNRVLDKVRGTYQACKGARRRERRTRIGNGNQEMEGSMKMNWNDWLLGAVVVALICSALEIIYLVDAYASTADSAARAVHRADVAEQALVACLNKRPIVGDDRTVTFCEPITNNL